MIQQTAVAANPLLRKISVSDQDQSKFGFAACAVTYFDMVLMLVARCVRCSCIRSDIVASFLSLHEIVCFHINPRSSVATAPLVAKC